MAAMGSMGSRARLWLDTPSMALKRVLLMHVRHQTSLGIGYLLGSELHSDRSEIFALYYPF
jgi:hypothetical protein